MNIKKILLLVVLPLSFLAACLAAFFLLGYAAFSLIEEEPEPGVGFGPISEVGAGQIPPEYLPVYEAAAAKYDVPWNLLAAIHRVETNFSTIGNMESYAGAIGHLQFMPCTWVGWSHPSCGGLGRGNIGVGELTNPAIVEQYGGFGMDANGDGKSDPFDIEDAIFAAARYLAQSGAAAGDYRKAVFTYNHSEKYVTDVLGFMNQFVDYQPVVLVPGTGGFNRPTNAPVSSPFEMRFHPIYKEWRLHAGIDLDCATGDPIVASKDGVVSYSGWMNAARPKFGLGIYVWVEHGGGYKTSYGHMSQTSVKVGQTVRAGDVVGACGNTGGSTGDHLHFEIFQNNKQVDPAPFLGL